MNFLTPQQVVYEAWLSTPEPVAYHTRDADKNEIVVGCTFLDPQDHIAYDPDYRGVCNLCGQHIQGGIPHKDLLGSTYTDWSIHRAPEKSHICAACAFCLMRSSDKGRIGLNKYSFVAADMLKLCNRAEMRDAILNPPDPPFVMACAVSQKKHIVTKSMVSYSKERFFCNLEEEIIEVKLAKAREMMNFAEALRGIGITKDDICNGNLMSLIPKSPKKISFEIYNMIEQRISDYLEERLFQLIVHVSSLVEEGDAKCYLDSLLTTV